MAVCVKTGRATAYLLLVLLLFYMTAAALYTGADAAAASAGGKRGGKAAASGLHGDFVYTESIEAAETGEQAWNQRPECGPGKRPDLATAAICPAAACPPNGFFGIPEAGGRKLATGIIAGFQHAGDGMK